MNLSDVQKRLAAPFPSHLVTWKPGATSKDKTRALMMAFIDARAVMDRLDAVCPDAWSFDVRPLEGAKAPTMIGTLIVLGVSRSDVGEGDPSSEAGNSYKAAASDALKRCAVHFGIGRYLYDLPKQWVEWDADKRQPRQKPALPEWARPDYERTPGGAHLVQAVDQLRYELPEDLEAQREVYKHLKAALSSLHPVVQARETESEGDRASTPVPAAQGSNPVVGSISKTAKQQIAAHLKGPRWGFVNDERRRAFTAFLAGVTHLGSSGDLTEQQGQDVLKRLQSCRDPEALLAEWQATAEGRVA